MHQSLVQREDSSNIFRNGKYSCRFLYGSCSLGMLNLIDCLSSSQLTFSDGGSQDWYSIDTTMAGSSRSCSISASHCGSSSILSPSATSCVRSVGPTIRPRCRSTIASHPGTGCGLQQ